VFNIIDPLSRLNTAALQSGEAFESSFFSPSSALNSGILVLSEGMTTATSQVKAGADQIQQGVTDIVLALVDWEVSLFSWFFDKVEKSWIHLQAAAGMTTAVGAGSSTLEKAAAALVSSTTPATIAAFQAAYGETAAEQAANVAEIQEEGGQDALVMRAAGLAAGAMAKASIAEAAVAPPVAQAEVSPAATSQLSSVDLSQLIAAVNRPAWTVSTDGVSIPGKLDAILVALQAKGKTPTPPPEQRKRPTVGGTASLGTGD
jgi:hypothetical protein